MRWLLKRRNLVLNSPCARKGVRNMVGAVVESAVSAAALPEGEINPPPPAKRPEMAVLVIIVARPVAVRNNIPWDPSPGSTFGWDGDL